jgi:hypothetical protein
MKTTEPNQALEPTRMLVTDPAAQAPRQASVWLISQTFGTMKSLIRLVVVGLVVVCTAMGDESEPRHNYMPQAGYVPDEKTAIAIAVAVWVPIYGEKQIKNQKPYKAELRDGIWYVSGSFKNDGWSGGVAEAEIVKDDARVIRVTHGK